MKSKDFKGLTNEGAKQMVYQQKRAMLREFVDWSDGKGIKIRAMNDFDIYFSIKSLRRSRGMGRKGDWRGEW